MIARMQQGCSHDLTIRLERIGGIAKGYGMAPHRLDHDGTVRAEVVGREAQRARVIPAAMIPSRTPCMRPSLLRGRTHDGPVCVEVVGYVLQRLVPTLFVSPPDTIAFAGDHRMRSARLVRDHTNMGMDAMPSLPDCICALLICGATLLLAIVQAIDTFKLSGTRRPLLPWHAVIQAA